MATGLVIVSRGGRPPVTALAWETDMRAAAEGRDLAGAARTLSYAELEWWAKLFRARSMPFELKVIERELAGRSADQWTGSLWDPKHKGD